MRQGVSFFIFLFSIKYIKNKEVFKYVVCIILAAGFHKTAYLLLPFYFLAYYRKLLGNRLILVSVYVFTWLLGHLMFDLMMSASSVLLEEEYSQYTNSINVLQMKSQTGLGLLMLHICDIIIILAAPICQKVFKNDGFDIYFNIFICGTILQNIAGMNMLLARIPFCMTSMRIFVGAFTIYLGLNISKFFPNWDRSSKSLMKAGAYIFIICAIAFLVGNCMRFDYTFVFNH